MPIDPRLLRIGIEVSGQIRYYEDLNIEASGTKFANANENECEVKISNLSKTVRDYILSETSPFLKSKTPKRLIVEAGRLSTGYSTIFIGDIISAVPSQPPDIELTIKAQTGSTSKGDIVAKSFGEKTNLSQLAKEVAKDLGLVLVFNARDKKVSNYSFTGGKLKQVEELGRMGGVNAFIDDDKLVVKDVEAPLNGKTQLLDKTSGMIGLPEITEHGIKVKYLYNNESAIGGALEIRSEINPAANGSYIIYKLSFDLASRNNQFYLTAEAKRT